MTKCFAIVVLYWQSLRVILQVFTNGYATVWSLCYTSSGKHSVYVNFIESQFLKPSQHVQIGNLLYKQDHNMETLLC